jgi:hypothetical protein
MRRCEYAESPDCGTDYSCAPCRCNKLAFFFTQISQAIHLEQLKRGGKRYPQKPRPSRATVEETDSPAAKVHMCYLRGSG